MCVNLPKLGAPVGQYFNEPSSQRPTFSPPSVIVYLFPDQAAF